jgi:DNA repair protein RecN (Recombination protein N)
MIKSLTIENYAIIDRVDIEFDRRLNIITGETGAGKSIILGALALIMGQRADKKVLYNLEKKCVVEAIFNGNLPGVIQLLESHDFDTDNELIIRREIVPSGKSRAFVNDTPAKLDFLQLLSLELIDLNQQFNIIDIHNTGYQLEMIDALADNKNELVHYKAAYKNYKSKIDQLNRLNNLESAQLKELDFMRFQLNELEEAGLTPTEQTELESEFQVLSKSDELRLLVEETQFKLADGEINVMDILAELNHKWSSYAGVSELIATLNEELSNVEILLSEFYQRCGQVENTLDSDPAKLALIQERLDMIYRLQKKHGVQNMEDLLEIQSGLSAKLHSYDNRSAEIEKLHTEIKALKTSLLTQGEVLSKKRKAVVPALEKSVKQLLDELAMTSAEIKVDMETSKELRSDGLDQLEMLFKPNKGGQFLPIKKVASGGESSRLMLALKSTVAHAMDLPVMIFDEIDTGVSGEVAANMGDILKSLAASHQLICITHSPQVSARADRHFWVYKDESKDRTFTHVKTLNQNERIIEIAKMLSGDPPSTFALDNAKDLLSKTEET